MRYTLDTPINPVQGDTTAWQSRFLWWPRQIDNQIVWWETVTSRKIYMLRQRATKNGTAMSGQWEREYKLKEST